MANEDAMVTLRLRRPVGPDRDHVRGPFPAEIVLVGYEDFLCPYCRRLRQVYLRLRDALGDRLAYVFRHFPNERAHPGAELVARAAEAAGRQGAFWAMHDRLFAREPPITATELEDIARDLGLDIERFTRDLESDEVRGRVAQDLEDGRRNGVTGTPTLFVDGLRYDGAWDFYSMLEALQRPVASRVQRTARRFASLPVAGGLVLLAAALVAIVLANTPLAAAYERVMAAPVGIGPVGSLLSLTVREWLSEGLLAIFFLLVGLEIRREVTAGALADPGAAILPVLAALGGVVVPAVIYLAIEHGPTAHGWAVPTATDIAFTLGILAVLGDRVPIGLRVFVAALAVVDDVLSILTLAIFYPASFSPGYLLVAVGGTITLFALNRARVYTSWLYIVTALVVWLGLHAAGVHGALTGVVLALLLPARPAPMPAPLLAQAATALAALEHAESAARTSGAEEWRLEREPVWDWASRNLSAAADRLLSPADRIERAVAPWSSFVILPLFALSATGVDLAADLSGPESVRTFTAIVVGLVVGKPLGILLASWLATRTRRAAIPDGVTPLQFAGAACLCGVAGTVALLMVERSFTDSAESAVAKLAVLVGTGIAALLGVSVLLLAFRHEPVARTQA
jgi:NhaA family Na+:H+ antiporter